MAKKRTKSTGKRTIIQNMGLFWSREHTLWRGDRAKGQASLLGLRAGAKRSGEVDFWHQVGIYAMYTEDYHLVYVGQAGIGDKACIGSRLKAHTRDDLAGRWELFSWFGLRKVVGGANPKLGAKLKKANTSWPGIADILEGVVIEIAEPPMNSQKGRFGKGVHRYLQAPPPPATPKVAPEIKTLESALSKVNKKQSTDMKRLTRELAQIKALAKKASKKK